MSSFDGRARQRTLICMTFHIRQTSGLMHFDDKLGPDAAKTKDDREKVAAAGSAKHRSPPALISLNPFILGSVQMYNIFGQLCGLFFDELHCSFINFRRRLIRVRMGRRARRDIERTPAANAKT